jgi:hypothetical protein
MRTAASSPQQSGGAAHRSVVAGVLAGPRSEVHACTLEQTYDNQNHLDHQQL